MKTKSTELVMSLERNDIEHLTSEVKETLFLGFDRNNTKNFTAASLWNIQRNRRNIPRRKFYENV